MQGSHRLQTMERVKPVFPGYAFSAAGETEGTVILI